MPPVEQARRQFLMMGLNKKATPLRPPWALDEEAFHHACSRCGDCLEKCPEGILVREGINGYPIVDFKRGECTFCGDCVTACPTTALSRNQASPWTVKAKAGDRCLAIQQVLCTTCAEQCEAGAIRFTARAVVVAQPEINTEICTGCGACVAPCPTQAIEVCL